MSEWDDEGALRFGFLLSSDAYNSGFSNSPELEALGVAALAEIERLEHMRARAYLARAEAELAADESDAEWGDQRDARWAAEVERDKLKAWLKEVIENMEGHGHGACVLCGVSCGEGHASYCTDAEMRGALK